jgi:hypothetical protein
MTQPLLQGRDIRSYQMLPAIDWYHRSGDGAGAIANQKRRERPDIGDTDKMRLPGLQHPIEDDARGEVGRLILGTGRRGIDRHGHTLHGDGPSGVSGTLSK